MNVISLKSNWRTAVVAAALGIIAMMAPAFGAGAITNWKAGANSTWGVAGNWDNGVPTTSDTAVFDGSQSNFNCDLDNNYSVANIRFANGYGGIFNFAGYTLTLTGGTNNNTNADFRSGGSFSWTTGGNITISLNTANRNLIPPSGKTLPNINFNVTSGTTVRSLTVTTNALWCGVLTIGQYGTFVTGAFADSISGFATGAAGTTSPALTFTNGGTLKIAAATVDFSGLKTITASGGILQFAGASAQTFTPAAGLTHPPLQQVGAGGTTVQTNALTCGALTLNGGNITAQTALTCAALTLTNGSLTTQNTLNCAAVTLTSGTLTLGGTMTASGTLTVGASGLLDLGSGYTHTLPSITAGTAGGRINYNNSTLQVSGAVALTNTYSTPGTGMLDLNNGSTAQNFTPYTGNSVTSNIMPNVRLSGSAAITVNGAGFRCNTLIFNNASASFVMGAFADTINNLSGSSGGITFTSGGSLCDSAAALDLTSCPTFTLSGGVLKFWGSAVQTLTPSASQTNPPITVAKGSGTALTTQTNPLACGANAIIVSSGTLNLGTATTCGAMTLTTGALNAQSTLSCAAVNVNGGTMTTSGTTTASGTITLGGGNLTTQSTLGCVAVTVTSGTMTLGGAMTATGALTLNSSTNAVLNLGSSMTHSIASIAAGTGGQILFNNSTLRVSGAVNLSNDSCVSTAGTLELTNSANMALTPKNGAGTMMPDLKLSGSAQVRVSGTGFRFGQLIFNGTTGLIFDASYSAAGYVDTVTNIQMPAIGTLKFSTSGTIYIMGTTADLSGLTATTTPLNGTFQFDQSFTQNFVPSSNFTLPAINHTGTGALNIQTNDLTCDGFTQTNAGGTAGPLNLNGNNLKVNAGNFAITNSVARNDFTGSTITVIAGNASFTGVDATHRLKLIGSDDWIIDVPLSNTLTATYADIAHSIAQTASGTANNSGDSLNNQNWAFMSGKVWGLDGTTAGNWSAGANWVGGVAPGPGDTVTFSSTHTAPCQLDGNDTVKYLIFGVGSSKFNFNGYALNIAGTYADFRNSGGITTSSGSKLQFLGSQNKSIWIKSGQVFPDIHQNGTGTTFISGTSGAIIKFGNCTIDSGAIDLGTGLIDTVGTVSGNGGSIYFNSASLYVTGNADFRNIVVYQGNGASLYCMGTGTQTFYPRYNATFPQIYIGGTGTAPLVTVSTNGLITAGALTIRNGTFGLGSNLTHQVGSIGNAAPNTGIIDFGSNSSIQVNGNAGFASIAISPGTGSALVIGAASTLTPPTVLDTLPDVIQNAAGATTTISASNFVANGLTVISGTVNLTGGYKDVFLGNISGSGMINLNNNILRMFGTSINFSSFSSITAGTGTLEFAAGSGTQTLTPPANDTLPAILHDSAGTLQLAGFDCFTNGFTQTAGVLDLGSSRNITTVSSGPFVILNGINGALAGFTGRRIKVSGYATLSGTDAGHLLNLDAPLCTLDVAGALTAVYATVKNNNALTSPGTGVNCTYDGTNINWNFGNKMWNGSVSGDWNVAGNWTPSGVPGPADIVLFSNSTVSCNMTINSTVKSIIFLSTYTGGFNFGTYTLSDSGVTDLRAGTTMTSNSGTIQFFGTGSQSFIPQPNQTFASIIQNGTGTTTQYNNNCYATSFIITQGTFNLGSALTDSVSTVSGAGNLNFNTSTLEVGGATADFSSFTSIIRGQGALMFTGAGAQSLTAKAGLHFPAININQNPVTAPTGVVTFNSNITCDSNLIFQRGTVNLGTGNNDTVGSIYLPISNKLDTLIFGTNNTLIITGATTTQLLPNMNLNGGTGPLYTKPGTGNWVKFTYQSGNFSFVQHNSIDTFPNFEIAINPAYTFTLYNQRIKSQDVKVTSGTLLTNNAQAASLNDTIYGSLIGNGGNLNIAVNSVINLFGPTTNLDGFFSIITNSPATLRFLGTGTQVFTPKKNDTLTGIAVIHAGAGTLQLSANPLIAGSFSQTAGVLDFNSQNISTAYGGSFSVANGVSGSIINLAGRTIYADGGASFTGTNGTTHIGLSPASSWTIAANGSLNAKWADIQNSTASISEGFADSCTNNGGNINWSFLNNAKIWQGATSSSWSDPTNWSGGTKPLITDTVYFSSAYKNNCNLDGLDTVAAIIFNSSYTGVFAFTSETLSVTGYADFRSGGYILPGSGAVQMIGNGNQNIIPRAAANKDTLPLIIENSPGGTGITTVFYNPLHAAGISLIKGQLNLGANLTHLVGTVYSDAAGSGNLNFGSSTLSLYDTPDDFSNLGTLTAGTGTLAFVSKTAQMFLPDARAQHPNIIINSSNTVTINGGNLSAGSLSFTKGTLNLGNGLTHQFTSINAGTAGTINFNTSTMQVSGTTNMTNLSILPGTGRLEFTNSTSTTFTPKGNQTYPDLKQSGSGTTTVGASITTAGNLIVTAGTFNLGAGFSHTFSGITGSGSATLNFNSSTLRTPAATVDLSGFSQITPSTGTLAFTGTSGSQIFIPQPFDTMPTISHTGSDTLRLSTYDLTASAFSQSDGTLDFNGHNLTTVSNGNFVLTNGTSNSFANHGGRHVTVSGYMSVTGQSANLLDMNPASYWNLAVTGMLTADYAAIAKCSSMVSIGIGSATCTDGGNNYNWTFTATREWSGLGSTNNWSEAANWVGNQTPAANEIALFSTRSIKNCILDILDTVNGVNVAPGYVGTINFGSETLCVKGNLNFSNIGTVIGGTGVLQLIGDAMQTFIPKAGATFPSIVQNGNGGTTISNNSLSAGALFVNKGTFNLGAGFTHSVTKVNGTASGTLNFNTSTLQASDTVNLNTIGAIVPASGTLSFISASTPQIFIPKLLATHPNITQNGSAGTTIISYPLTAGNLTLTSGTLHLGANLTHAFANVSGAAAGAIDFGSCNMQVSGTSVDFSALTSVTKATGTLAFTSASAQSFVPKTGAVFPPIIQSGAGQTTLGNNNLRADSLILSAGIFNLGTILSDTVSGIRGTAGLYFGSSSLQTTADSVNFNALSSLNGGSGSLIFAGSGTQVFVPKTGSMHPAVSHTGTGTLKLSSTAVDTLITNAFSNSAGAFNFNNDHIRTTGNFTITGGNGSTLAGLGGRLITVGGNATLSGTSAQYLDLNPGSAWTIGVTGALSATYATLQNSTASVATGTAVNCTNVSGNVNWTFINMKVWNGSAGDNNWSTAGNWNEGAAPIAADSVLFNATAVSCNLSSSPTVKAITFTPGFTGTFNGAGYTLTLTAAADFRSGGGFTNTRITFAGTSAQTFIPKTGGHFTKITQNAGGQTLTISTNNCTSDTLAITAGTVNLGAAFSDTITVVTGTGTLNFGSSTLSTASPKFNLSTLADVIPGSGIVCFTKATGTADTFVPRASDTMPAVLHTGTDTLRLLTNDLICNGFTQSAGTLDLNGRNVSTANTGTFTISGGSSTSFAGLAGRTIYSDGDATFSGVSGNLLNMNASGTYTIQVKSGKSLTANYANIAYCTALPASPGGTALQSSNSGNNVNWNFATTGKIWTATPTSSKNWYDNSNWSGGTIPGSNDSVIFIGSSVNCSFNATNSPTVKYLIFNSSYTGTFDFKTNTLNIGNNADFRSGGTITPGTGTVVFTGSSGTQVLIPSAAATLPAISHTGSNTLQLATNDLSCNSFSQSNGTLDFNGRNITTSGNFTITSGSSSSFTGLGGRTITVHGNATLNGQSGSQLNLNPGSSWTIACSKNLTADYANINYSTASSSPGFPSAACNDQTHNTNWFFAEDYSAWKYSRSVTVNTTNSNGGANVATTLVSYPVLLRLRASNFNFDSAQNTGADIRFARGSVHLSYEIERWVNGWGTADSADIWVRMDTILGNNSSQTITLYWGNAGATSRSSSASVFNSFAGVWHSGTELQDASINGNDATNYNTTDIVGLSGRGRYYNGSSAYLNTGANGLGITDSLTVSAWINLANGSQNASMRIISKKNSWSSPYGYDLLMQPYNQTISIIGSGTTIATTSIGKSFGTVWHYIAATITGTSAKIYMDSSQIGGSFTVGAMQTDATTLAIGRQTIDGTDYFYGTIDEPTVANFIRPTWVQMNYAVQKPRETCIDWQWPFISGLGDTIQISSRQAGPDSVRLLYELEDPDDATDNISGQYRINNGSWSAMTNTAGDIGAGIDATSRLTTRAITWHAKTQLGVGIDTLYQARLIAADVGGHYDTTAGLLFRIDAKAPSGLAGFAATETTGTQIRFIWTSATDRNFSHYEIWYDTILNNVQNRLPAATCWNNVSDPALSSPSAATTLVTGLLQNKNYYWEIYALDSIGNSATLTAINVPTRSMITPQWSHAAFAGPVNGGSIGDNSIYVGTGGSEKTLFSINLANGSNIWSYVTSSYGACNMPTYIYSAKAGGKYRVLASAGNYVISRLDNGATSSENFTPIDLGAAAGNPYASPDDSTFVVVYGNNIVRKKITDGTTITGWPVGLSNVSRLADPVVYNDEAYVATTDGVVKKYYMDGTPGPSVNVSAGVNLPLLIDDSTLFVSPDNDTLYAFRIATMAQKWKIQVGGKNTGATFTPLAGRTYPSHRIYIAASKKVQRITDNGGSASIDWTFDAGDTVASGPIIFNGKVYFGRNGGRYYSITDNGTGATLNSTWPYTGSSGNANVGPWIDAYNNRAIFGSTGGKLDAFTLP
jgi:hypothetical protein